MSGQRYTPEFKDEAVKLITKHGYSVTHVAELLGVSQHSIYSQSKNLNVTTVAEPLSYGSDHFLDRLSSLALESSILNTVDY
ncbi:hypothetical protein F896_01006 [Acinetobacter genomosp. 15BJ]|uniref:Transposase n=1 Tax=Acinetobacter genomosp. 15BJ TaxID=106651 RepID=R9B405_9GAMM|nr:hypothetical protein F896_01006 [Acinetobacter genomosp. 15BJ]